MIQKILRLPQEFLNQQICTQYTIFSTPILLIYFPTKIWNLLQIRIIWNPIEVHNLASLNNFLGCPCPLDPNHCSSPFIFKNTQANGSFLSLIKYWNVQLLLKTEPRDARFDNKSRLILSIEMSEWKS